MRNILLEIEYDGSGFSGWQAQPGKRTVQGELTRALSLVCGAEVRLNGTSRTDAGVHAYGQAANFTGDFGIPADRIPLAVNNLTEDVKIVGARDVAEDFHARHDAAGKTYLYRISATKTPDIFMRKYRYQVTEELDADGMRMAADALIGTHDFSSFRSAGGSPDADPVKTLTGLTVRDFQGTDSRGEALTEYEIRVTGSAFLYNMVRIIAGTLVETGLGKRRPESMAETLAAKERRRAGSTAPAAGLWLEKVHFKDGAS
ncbi:MAG: tRNA pseudouridine(38-40) synthase TruA [Clostridiales Family XIII bacterium]|jgi:tRNA pseudouridine38-40 synthase|nr:tRNA pseudouridine(38-40) synthase TruA [Clostridiales Family XIII bacterium]